MVRLISYCWCWCGVLDALVVLGEELFIEDFFQGFDLGQGEGGLLELAFLDALSDDLADVSLEFFWGEVVQGAGAGFEGIGEVEDGFFFGAGEGAVVAEVGLVGGVRVLSAVAFPEVGDEGGAVMGLDAADDFFGEAVVAGEFYAIGYVGFDDVGAFFWGEVEVGVGDGALGDGGEVFDEVGGVFEFSDVVEEGHDVDFEGMGADFAGGGFGEDGDGEAVLVGTWGFLG